MTIPSWTTTADWDTVYIGGKALPGVAKLDVKLGSGLDVQKPKGAKKATIKDEGTPPTELTLTLTFNPDALADVEAAVNTLRPKSVNGARSPQEIAHPLARLWGVNVVTIGPIDSPSPEAGGAMVITVDLVEWSPAPKKVKKPDKKPKGEAERVPEYADVITLAMADRVQTQVYTDDDGDAPIPFQIRADSPGWVAPEDR
jgi:hypothetical protein